MQYSDRHFFHLEFIAWAALGFVLERAAVAAFRLVRRPAAAGVPDAASRPLAIAGRVVSFAALATLLVGGPLLALRWYQDVTRPHAAGELVPRR